MIEAYSQNINVTANSNVPFNNVKLIKGRYTTLQGAGTFQFNHCGVYHLTCNGSVTGTGEIVLQVMKNGVVQPQTVTPITGAAGTDIPFALDTFIQVPNVNNGCCGQSPVEVVINNAGVDATFNLIDVKITKVC